MPQNEPDLHLPSREALLWLAPNAQQGAKAGQLHRTEKSRARMQRVQGLLTLLFSVGTRQETSATSSAGPRLLNTPLNMSSVDSSSSPVQWHQCTNESSISNE